jgi:hypothetical protein
MVASRIEVAYQVGPTNDTLTVTHSVTDAGNPNVITLTHGLYETADTLCDEVQTRLQAFDADLECTRYGHIVTIEDSNGDTFSVTWTRTGLRDWLGFSGDLAAANSYTAPGYPAGTYIAHYPWRDASRGLRYALRPDKWQCRKVSKHAVWDVTSLHRWADRHQWIGVAKQLVRGQRFTWFRNSADSIAWSWSNYDGFVIAVLSPDLIELGDSWMTEPSTAVWEVPLSMVVVT